MRVLTLMEWSRLAVTDHADPILGDHDVELEVLATGICGSDLHGFTGENGRRRPGQIMGHETVGRVVAIGDGVRPEEGIRVGAIATVNPVIGCQECATCGSGAEQACEAKEIIGVTGRIGAFAERLVAPSSNIVVLPASMPAEYGALVEPLAVGYHAVRRGDVGAGHAVLVIGGGPVGQACVLTAQRRGAASVAVTEPSPPRRQINEKLGAETVDPASTGPAGLADAVRELLGRSPDVVIDAVGTENSLASAFACASANSPIVLVGMGQPRLTLPAFEISTQERSLIGSFCYSADEFREAATLVGEGPAAMASMIGGTVDLDGAPAAFASLATDAMPRGKILVLPQGSLS